MAEIRINATGGLKLYDADDSHYAQIVAGTITSNTDVMTLGHAAVVMGTKLDMNGSNLVLDADADTYLDTGTDDTIKVYVSGAEDLRIAANAINVLSGTTLTIDSGATITNSGTANGFSSADPSSADGDSLGTASAEWSDLYLADAGVIYFGNDQDITLTHAPDTGLILGGTTPTLTIGDAGAEDTKIVFDGNAQDFHIGLDDTADDLVIGLGSALGTTTHMAFDEAGHITMPLQSCFSAYSNAASSNATGGGTEFVVVLDTERFDQNADFNTGTYTFTAPVTGRYLLSGYVVWNNMDEGSAVYFDTRLVTSNVTYTVSSGKGGANTTNYGWIIQNTIIADMDASDTCVLRAAAHGGTDAADIGDASRLTGCLLA